MKTIICILTLVLSAQADRDWSKIRIPQFDPISKEIVTVPIAPSLRPKIVGGEEAQEHSLPYQAALFVNTQDGILFCGGVLVSRLFVLTASHCVTQALGAEVVLGAHNVMVNEPTQVSINAASILVHLNYTSTPNTVLNDIAAIRLQQQAPNNRFVQPVNLPTFSDITNTFAGRSSLISGWGRISDNVATISETLNVVEVPVTTNLLCNINFLGSILESHVCTSGEGGRGTCGGDSGGPVVVDGTLVGLVSFGLALGCEAGWPSVHTRITTYLNWIQQNTDVTITL